MTECALALWSVAVGIGTVIAWMYAAFLLRNIKFDPDSWRYRVAFSPAWLWATVPLVVLAVMVFRAEVGKRVVVADCGKTKTVACR